MSESVLKFPFYALLHATQSDLANDDKLKRYSTNLADDWIALDNAVMANDVYGKPSPSP
jgi:hypothetical protein